MGVFRVRPPAGRSKCRYGNLNTILLYEAYVSYFNRIWPLTAEIYTFKVLQIVIFRQIGPIERPRKQNLTEYYWEVLIISIHISEGEPAAINHLDSRAPNVRTVKTLNSAYLDPLPRPLVDVYLRNLLVHNWFYLISIVFKINYPVTLCPNSEKCPNQNAQKWVFSDRGPAPCWTIKKFSWNLIEHI